MVLGYSTSSRGWRGLNHAGWPMPCLSMSCIWSWNLERKDSCCTLEVAMALAVCSAPEPCSAILTACQQPLPIWTQTEPVDASLVFSADLHRWATVPHAVGPTAKAENPEGDQFSVHSTLGKSLGSTAGSLRPTSAISLALKNQQVV